MPSDRLRRFRDAIVAQRTAFIERAALLAIGVTLVGWNLFTLGPVSRIDGFGLLPLLLGVTLAMLAVSEFLPEERAYAILAIRLSFLALVLVSVGLGTLLLLFVLNNAP
ncbi:hypothetical protein [Halorubrum sp. Atlit-28R]|jgi:hypothetical protein|uniref:hypothetical protein n=1 Tax=Halorubrum sp. Atlit-28R TaxID=2282129 RepID=UPI000EF267A5|nr:hypothetical protein [Halorubrum sp. Atlit-28R]RLM51626.1 hypothetical protein DVK06_04300 [Halorubrum sp. Atlit-28R]